MGMIVSEATIDRLIEERTEARAEAFRAQERVRELETLLGAWGEAQTEWWCAKKNEEAQVTIDRWGSEYHQARYRVGKAERELETAREAASRVAVEIATKRREEK